MTADGRNRSCGVWLHLTALPGPRGCGTIGREAFDFADLLAESGQSVWQILPNNPVRGIFNHSPYSPASCFAGNPLLIDESALIREFSLPSDLLSGFPDTRSSERCVWDDRWRALKKILWASFDQVAEELEKIDAYRTFCREAQSWLDDFALYECIADHVGRSDWRSWPEMLLRRDSEALDEFIDRHEREISWYRFVQYTFFSQWRRLRSHCNKTGVRLLGDMPLYGQFDSADVWANPEVYQIDGKTLQSTFVAGVPPDYFSQDGQLWGNPLYRWYTGDDLSPDTLRWWRNRISWALQQTDMVRIDHFRGIEAFWSVPATAVTARDGSWQRGPGFELFDQLSDILGKQPPLVAEDLGIITPEVENLRDRLGLPGMKILQFAFGGGDDHPYLPHNIDDQRPWILYLGTHDNNTTVGWLEEELNAEERERVERYVEWSQEKTLVWRIVEAALASKARTVLLSVGDLLEYGSEARFNVPGKTTGNWTWKLSGQNLRPVFGRLSLLCRRYQRDAMTK